MQTHPAILTPQLKSTGRRVGYAIAVLINLMILIVVQNILGWGWEWFRFLTDEFERVVPYLTFSVGLTAFASFAYMVFDDRVLHHAGQIGVNFVNLSVTLFILRVFPFDFSTYGFDWEDVARIVLILAIVGTAIGIIAEIVQLVKGEPGITKEASNADGI